MKQNDSNFNSTWQGVAETQACWHWVKVVAKGNEPSTKSRSCSKQLGEALALQIGAAVV